MGPLEGARGHVRVVDVRSRVRGALRARLRVVGGRRVRRAEGGEVCGGQWAQEGVGGRPMSSPCRDRHPPERKQACRSPVHVGWEVRSCCKDVQLGTNGPRPCRGLPGISQTPFTALVPMRAEISTNPLSQPAWPVGAGPGGCVRGPGAQAWWAHEQFRAPRRAETDSGCAFLNLSPAGM